MPAFLLGLPHLADGPLLAAQPQPPTDPVEARLAAAAEELRVLHEQGEMEWADLYPLVALQWAFLDEGPDPEAAAEAA